MSTAPVKHSRQIEKDEQGEYSVSCSCRTAYAGRLQSWGEAVARDAEHKRAVASGEWQAQLDAEAARLQALAPLHQAITAHYELTEQYRSLGFEILIERQAGRNADRLRAHRAEVGAQLAEAAAHLDAVRASA